MQPAPPGNCWLAARQMISRVQPGSLRGPFYTLIPFYKCSMMGFYYQVRECISNSEMFSDCRRVCDNKDVLPHTCQSGRHLDADPRGLEGEVQREGSFLAAGEVTRCGHFERQAARFLRSAVSSSRTIQDPAGTFRGVYPDKELASKQKRHAHVCICFIHNCKNLDATTMPFSS